MNRFWGFPVFFGLFLVLFLDFLVVGRCSSDETFRLMVKFRDGVDGKRNELHPRFVKRIRHLSQIDVHVVESPSLSALEFYQSHPYVQWVEQDGKGEGGVITDDPRVDEQWALNKLEVEKVWNITTGTTSVSIAVLDSGIQFDHPDFAETTILPGYDYVNNDNDPTDDHDHGTHVSGIIAASINNGVGVAGFANVSIVPLKVLDSSNSGFYSDWVEAMMDAADDGIPIISMSLQGTPVSSALEQGAAYAWNKGSLLVVCAGNFQINPGLDSQLGTYNTTLAVMNLRQDDARNPSSNIGSYVDVGAPGTSILSTLIGSTYGTLTGCSMATPYVSAYAALLLSVNPYLTNQDLWDIIIENVDDLGPVGKDNEFGHGRINPHRGLMRALELIPTGTPSTNPSTTEPPSTQPPTTGSSSTSDETESPSGAPFVNFGFSLLGVCLLLSAFI